MDRTLWQSRRAWAFVTWVATAIPAVIVAIRVEAVMPLAIPVIIASLLFIPIDSRRPRVFRDALVVLGLLSFIFLSILSVGVFLIPALVAAVLVLVRSDEMR